MTATIDEIIEQLRVAVVARGYRLTFDDHVTEQCAADLLALAPKTLSNWRAADQPIAFRKNSRRVEYALRDLAVFIAERGIANCPDLPATARNDLDADRQQRHADARPGPCSPRRRSS